MWSHVDNFGLFLELCCRLFKAKIVKSLNDDLENLLLLFRVTKNVLYCVSTKVQLWGNISTSSTIMII